MAGQGMQFKALIALCFWTGFMLLTGVCDIYTSIADMETLVGTLGKVTANLEEYILVQKSQLQLLKRKYNEILLEHAEAKENLEAYVHNPINSYLLTKRLTSDWKGIQNVMAYDSGEEFVKNITRNCNTLRFPTDEDLIGAVTSLIRLQALYKMEPVEMADGQLSSHNFSKEMDASDCFILAKTLYNDGDFYYAMLWFEETWHRLPENGTTDYATEAEILEHWAYSAFKEENYKLARAVAREMLRAEPENEHLNEVVAIYENNYLVSVMEQKEQDLLNRNIHEMGMSDKQQGEEDQEPVKKDQMSRREKYEALCRGEVQRPLSHISKLKCRYVDTNILYTKIAPFKMEDMSLDPFIVMYHDVISDSEIETVKRKSQPKFHRAGTYDPTNVTRYSTYRIGKLAWLKDHEDEVIATLSRRIEAITDLNMQMSEELQVVNYGIGGHYRPHHDFARKEENGTFKGTEHMGNRIATFLVYMSDVEEGGATVFPAVDITVFPKKGSATFWWNLYKSGEGDYRTNHASCPVLIGSKWICNKWIHEVGQEVRRPCGIENDAPSDEKVEQCYYCSL